MTSTRRLAERALGAGPLPFLARHASGHRLRVLAYHAVPDRARFEAHVQHLERYYRVVSPAQVLEAASGGARLPRRAVLITFDDGHRSVHTHALPVLRGRGLPAVCFVVADLVGSQEPFWWEEVVGLWSAGGRCHVPSGSAARLVTLLKAVPDDERLSALAELRASAGGAAARCRQLTADELRELDAAGVAVGNHTATHPCLTRCTTDKVDEEVGRAHRVLTSVLGAEPVLFAFPNGDGDGRVTAVLHRLGYRLAFLFDHRLADGAVGAPLAVSRIRVDASASPERFSFLVSGLGPASLRLRRRR